MSQKKVIRPRRKFLIDLGLVTAISAAGGLYSCINKNKNIVPETHDFQKPENRPDLSWKEVRTCFDLDPEIIHMASLFLASHPEPVREAIEKYRSALNRNPAVYVNENYDLMNQEVRRAIADFIQVNSEEIALTDSTTMGTGLIITGLRIREGQEMVYSRSDYYGTKEAIKYQSARTGAKGREADFYNDTRNITVEEIVDRIAREIRPNTRLLTATWVHSSTGLKVPVKNIAERIDAINLQRDPADRVIFFVDGVHGFGVEDISVAELGCDFFTTGTHKWMFGPRGTGFFWGHPRVHGEVLPTIPSFTNGQGWGGYMSPGGFKTFEHYWATIEAFRFQQAIGKNRIMEYTHQLARQLKEGLRKMGHVNLYTPVEEKLSASIVSFDIDGMQPHQVVERLREMKIIASVSPYRPPCARLTPSIYNTPEEIDKCLASVRSLR